MSLKCYAICGTLRCGSSWLCDLLRERGLGLPDEYLEIRVMNPLIEEWGIAREAYLRELPDRRSRNGYFGTKLFWSQLFYEWLPHDFDDVFPVPAEDVAWIHLTRDWTDQAKSWITARKVGSLFHTRGVYPQAEHTVDELAAFTQLVREHSLSWERWFRKRNLEVLPMTYEGLLGNTDLELMRAEAWIR